jgi:hypothetical protein
LAPAFLSFCTSWAHFDERAKKAKLVALELLVEPFLDLAAAFGVGGPVGEVRFARTDSC